MDYSGGESSGSNHYRISGGLRRRCLHWRLFERRNSCIGSGISVLQLSGQCSSARCQDRRDTLEDLRHAGQRWADRTNTAAARCGNHLRLIQHAARSSSAPATTTPYPQTWKRARTQLLSADCTAADDFFDTALALDLKTGQIKWAKKLQTFDTWTVACLTSSGPNQNCPVRSSPDFDLGGSGPNLRG